MELHAIVMRERPHKLICRKAETTLVEGHEAHDVAVVRPRLWFASRSHPLRPAGIGERAKETVVDKRL